MEELDKFTNDEIRIIKKDGKVLGPVKVLWKDTSLTIWDTRTNIIGGDVVVRLLADGQEERRLVTDIRYYPRVYDLAEHFVVKLDPAGGVITRPAPVIPVPSARPTPPREISTQDIITFFQTLLNQLESSKASVAEINEAKAELLHFFSHPLVVSVLGAAAKEIVDSCL